MKKFVNDPRQFVPEFLEGIQLASGGALKYEPKYNLIYRADMPKPDRVSIIQGSGSGHEPAHTMIVGPGMLDAACPGDVFAGPPVEFVTETSKLMETPKGVVVNLHPQPGGVWDRHPPIDELQLAALDDVAIGVCPRVVGVRGEVELRRGRAGVQHRGLGDPKRVVGVARQPPAHRAADDAGLLVGQDASPVVMVAEDDVDAPVLHIRLDVGEG